MKRNFKSPGARDGALLSVPVGDPKTWRRRFVPSYKQLFHSHFRAIARFWSTNGFVRQGHAIVTFILPPSSFGVI